MSKKNKEDNTKDNINEELTVSLNPQKKKSRKSKFAISCFVLLLAVGVLGNWYWENSDISSKVNAISGAKDKILGEATYVDATTEATTENTYYSSARIDRQNARDESLEKLQAIVDSQNGDDSSKKEAAEKIEAISNNIANENKIETLVTAKGVNNCIAVINDETGRVDIIVDVADLTDEIILQIKEIAMSQLNCSFENITIIQST